jgi:hypothetical protein
MMDLLILMALLTLALAMGVMGLVRCFLLGVMAWQRHARR